MTQSPRLAYFPPFDQWMAIDTSLLAQVVQAGMIASDLESNGRQNNPRAGNCNPPSRITEKLPQIYGKFTTSQRHSAILPVL